MYKPYLIAEVTPILRDLEFEVVLTYSNEDRRLREKFKCSPHNRNSSVRAYRVTHITYPNTHSISGNTLYDGSMYELMNELRDDSMATLIDDTRSEILSHTRLAPKPVILDMTLQGFRILRGHTLSLPDSDHKRSTLYRIDRIISTYEAMTEQ